MKSIAPLAVIALTAVLHALPAQAQRAANLQARTAGDLADLCATNPKDPLGDAKINFCHGFAQGAITAELRHTEGKKLFCIPSPAPTRTATMAEFVNWVRAMPERKGDSAVDGFFKFLSERFACK
jgi:hypothetical protein